MMYKYLCSILLIVGCFGTTQCIEDDQLGEKKGIPYLVQCSLHPFQKADSGVQWQCLEVVRFWVTTTEDFHSYSGEGITFADHISSNQRGFPGYIGIGQKKGGYYFPAGYIQNGEKKEIFLLPEFRNKIERPCKVSDIACIQHYFEEHSHCKAAYGVGPKDVRRVISNQFYPVINVTQINLDDKVTGLNTGRIQEFYINRETDKLVLGVEFQGLTRASKNTFLKYHRKAKEPVVTHGYTSVTFNSLYITITIPQIKNLRLDKADIFGKSDDVPLFEMSASLGQSSDKTVQLANAEFLVKKPIVASELLLTESPFYGAAYIQHAICDFGLQLI